jgi:4-hydroxy-2-oxoglutarate aldolase
MNPTQHLHGVFLPVTTPFKEDMSVDYDALKRNMEFYAQSNINGYLALGSNGENRCLRENEKKQVLETILAHRAGNQIVMAGCIYDSTPLTIEFMEFAKNAGADFATLLSPSYFRKQMTHEILVDYFTECADAVEIPVLLYNAPGFTGVTLEPQTIEILSKHPNIVGMKDSAPSGIENFCPFMSSSFAVLAGSANFFYPAMVEYGIPGGIISIANAIPPLGANLLDYAQQGGTDEGDRLHEIVKTANQKISGSYGVAGVKAAMDLAGLSGGYPRKPLKPLTDAQRGQIKQTLQELGLL